ncbi:hypothetical protein H2248_004981 [Termitomyces sp. 'cryptogamus']|nr:hypothetical protein H2248_004981 [Termitomyces sp. 'cryptogamus']
MPATRTGSRQQTSEVTLNPSLAHSPQPLTRSSLSKRRRETRPKSKPVVLGEVIEISSDDDEFVPRVDSVAADLRYQVKKLKEVWCICSFPHSQLFDGLETKENSRLKTELTTIGGELSSAKKEIAELKTTPGIGKGKLDVLQLDDNMGCEICTSRMWSPFILPECGHTFCLSCLQDWFGTTLAQFIAIHPDYHDQQTHNHRLWEAMMQNPLILRTPHAAAYYAQLQQQAPQPQYTCPTCREQVKNRPVEDFALKALIRAITTAAGEGSPKKLDKQTRGKATAPKTGPWDGFFPKVA